MGAGRAVSRRVGYRNGLMSDAPAPVVPVARRAWVWPVAGALLVGVLAWVVWGAPATRGDSVDVVVIGDGAVTEARDELLRRFRQEGMVPSVVEIDSADCADAAAHLHDAPTVVLSFADWAECDWQWAVDKRVEQPGGQGDDARPIGAHVRMAAPLFDGAERVTCEWWDTPGAGEDRPGLGQCEPDGKVTVLDDGQLTPAGRERFARLVVESVK